MPCPPFNIYLDINAMRNMREKILASYTGAAITEGLMELSRVEAAMFHLSILLNELHRDSPNEQLISNHELDDWIQTFAEYELHEQECVGWLTYAGILRHTPSQMDRAAVAAQKAVNCAVRADNSCLKAFAHNRLGNILRVLGHLDEAMKSRLTAYQIFLDKADERECANTLLGIGNLLLEQQKFVEGSKKLVEAINFALKCEDYQTALFCLRSLALAYHEHISRLGWQENRATQTLIEARRVGQQRGNMSRAIMLAQKALHFYEAEGDVDGVAQSKSLLALIIFETGQVELAVSYLDDAIEISRNRNDIASLYTFLFNHQALLGNSQQFDRRYKILKELLPVTFLRADLGYIIQIFERLFETSRILEDWEAAVQHGKHLSGFYTYLDEPTKAAKVHDDVATIQRNCNFLQDALDSSMKAISNFGGTNLNENSSFLNMLSMLASPPSKDLVIAYLILGQTYTYIGNWDRALQHLELVLPVLDRLDEPVNLIACLESLGQVCEGLNNYEKAKPYYRRALAIAHGDNLTDLSFNLSMRLAAIDPVFASQIGHMVNMGGLEHITLNSNDSLLQNMTNRATHDPFMAISITTEELNKIGDFSRSFDRVQSLILRAIAHRLNKKLQLSLQDAKSAFELLELVWHELRDTVDQIAFLGQPLMTTAIAVLFRLLSMFDDRRIELYELIETLHAKSLRVMLARTIPWTPNMIRPDRTIDGDLSDLIWHDLTRLMVSDPNMESSIRQMHIEGIQSFEQNVDTLLQNLEAGHPQYVRLRRGDSMSFEEIRKWLQNESEAAGQPIVLIQFWVSVDALYCIFLRHDWDTPRIEIINQSQDNLRQMIFKNFGDNTTSDMDNYRPNSQTVQTKNFSTLQTALEKLVTKIEAWTKKGEYIYFVPDDALFYIPLHALVVEQKALFLRNPIAYLPSSTVTRYTQDRRRQQEFKARGALVLGDSGDDLPYAYEEALTVSELLGVEAYLKDRASQSVIDNHFIPVRDGQLNPLTSTRVVHFACHGIYHESDPLKSGILLASNARDTVNTERSDAEQSQKHYLTAEYILKRSLRIDASLVVLSACETGVNRVYPGGEIFGLTRSLLHAGAASLISSLWAVNDVSTEILMRMFYEQLRAGFSKIEALNNAQKYVRKLTAQDVLNYHQEKLDNTSPDDIQRLQSIDSMYRKLKARITRQINAEDKIFDHPYYWAPFVLIGDWK